MSGLKRTQGRGKVAQVRNTPWDYSVPANASMYGSLQEALQYPLKAGQEPRMPTHQCMGNIPYMYFVAVWNPTKQL